jgi:hypothetical protein
MTNPTKHAGVRAALLVPLLALALAPSRAAAELEVPEDPPKEEPAAAPKGPRNRNLDFAKELVRAGKHEEALAELDRAAKLPNPNRIVMEIHATRAQALLLKKKPATEAARELIVEVLHFDPEAAILAEAPEPVRRLVEEIRAEQVVVLHDRIAVARTGRPVRVRARVIDPQQKVAALELKYRGQGVPAWSREPMKRDASGYSAYLRDPSVLAPPGVTDGYVVEYYVRALDAENRQLDSNGSDESPIAMEISSTKAEEAGIGRVSLSVIELREGPLPVQAEPAYAGPKPWWKSWYAIGGAAVVVGALAGGTAWALTLPPELRPSLGQIDFGQK